MVSMIRILEYLVNLVAVMDRILYNSLSKYYHVLEQTGYMSNTHAQKLLLLIFYRDFTLRDFRGKLSKDDYHLIEKALDCLWGSSCLIPYPDYLKMGRLHLGEATEMAQRLKALEDTEVLKLTDVSSDPGNDSDFIVEIQGEDS